MPINRRSFLSLIPAVSALPLTAQEILTKEGSIELINPSIATDDRPGVWPVGEAWPWQRAKVQVVVDGKTVSEGFITRLDLHREPIYTIDYNTRYKLDQIGPLEMEITARMLWLAGPVK